MHRYSSTRRRSWPKLLSRAPISRYAAIGLDRLWHSELRRDRFRFPLYLESVPSQSRPSSGLFPNHCRLMSCVLPSSRVASGPTPKCVPLVPFQSRSPVPLVRVPSQSHGPVAPGQTFFGPPGQPCSTNPASARTAIAGARFVSFHSPLFCCSREVGFLRA